MSIIENLVRRLKPAPQAEATAEPKAAPVRRFSLGRDREDPVITARLAALAEPAPAARRRSVAAPSPFRVNPRAESA